MTKSSRKFIPVIAEIFFLIGIPIATAATYEHQYRLGGAVGKTYTFQAKAYDAAGNVGVSNIVTLKGQ